MADVEIRKQTNNRFGLQDAMRGVLAAGGNHEVDWPMSRVLSVADAATGRSVLEELHNEMGAKAVGPDLISLWRDLGLKPTEAGVEVDDTAPLAAIRVSIVEKSSQKN